MNKELFQQWNESRDYPQFCNDGIIDEAEWLKSSPRIMFLLKESNAGFYENIAGKIGGWGPDGASKVFWRNLNIWTYVITELSNKRIPNFEDAIILKENKVCSVAYVNIKKKAENKSRSNNNDIYSYAVTDKDFILRQIEEINPDIICCCGTINSFRVIYDIQSVSAKVFKSLNRVVIDFYHPSCRISYQNTFDKLRNVLQAAEINKSFPQEK